MTQVRWLVDLDFWICFCIIEFVFMTWVGVRHGTLPSSKLRRWDEIWGILHADHVGIWLLVTKLRRLLCHHDYVGDEHSDKAGFATQQHYPPKFSLFAGNLQDEGRQDAGRQGGGRQADGWPNAEWPDEGRQDGGRQDDGRQDVARPVAQDRMQEDKMWNQDSGRQDVGRQDEGRQD